MRAKSVFRPSIVVALIVLYFASASGQSQGVLRIRITLPDADGRPAPVAQHRLLISDNPASEPPREVVTSRDGTAVIRLAPGNYTVESDQPLVVDGKAYSWWKTLDVPAGRETAIELTAADAEVETPRPASTASDARTDEASALLAQWQGAVVELWMPMRHASGFLVDARGLVATSQRMVEGETMATVQLSPSVKVAGLVIAAEPGRDVAILRIDPAALGSVTPLALGCGTTASAPPQKGQKVVAIETPLRMPKATSSGVLGRIGPHSLETDLDLESTTAGGPAFAVDGTLLGLTSIVDGSDERRPYYRVIRPGDICAVLASAEKAMANMPAPPGTRLPVEPAGAFPLDALEAAASRSAGTRTPFQTSSTFEVTLITPVRLYAARNRTRPTSLPARTMRNQSVDGEAIQREEGLFDFGRWADYFAGYLPVLIVRVTPRLKEGFWTTIARGAAQTQGMSLPPMKRLTSGFSRLEAFCSQIRVQPIHPFVLQREVATTTTTEGLYVFDPNALGPACDTVKLVLYSEKSPSKGETLVLDDTLLQQAWQDFAPYRDAQ
jgi:S1-C subfamily serine protease